MEDIVFRCGIKSEMIVETHVGLIDPGEGGWRLIGKAKTIFFQRNVKRSVLLAKFYLFNVVVVHDNLDPRSFRPNCLIFLVKLYVLKTYSALF